MPTRPSKREDSLQAAARIVEQVTGQPIPKQKPEITDAERAMRSQAASILGKLGGSKGGKARALKLSAEERSTIAKTAAKSRWTKPRPTP